MDLQHSVIPTATEHFRTRGVGEVISYQCTTLGKFMKEGTQALNENTEHPTGGVLITRVHLAIGRSSSESEEEESSLNPYGRF